MAKIVLHLKARDAVGDLPGAHLRWYRWLRVMAREAGIALDIRARDTDIRIGTRSISDGRFDDGNLHIIDDRSVVAGNVLNAGVAYLWGFWHLDPCGVKAFSSIGARAYDEAEIPFRRAKPFFERLRAHWVERRVSKYEQTQEVLSVPRQCLAVFFQGSYPQISGASEMDDLGMLRAVMAQAGDRPIVVKPHPMVSTTGDMAAVRALARKDARVTISEANVHDILSRCCASVSINSTVALEGFLHRKPAILFGQSDFHHIAGRVHAPGEFADVLARELERRGGYAQYLMWYFKQNCLTMWDRDLDERTWRIFAQAGFPREVFERGQAA